MRTMWFSAIFVSLLFLHACSRVEGPKPDTGPAATQSAADTNMEILKQKIKADKRFLVSSNMGLTDAESQAFWPLYDDYQMELQQVNEQFGKTIMDYAEVYDKGPIPNDTARSLMDRALAVEQAEVGLKRKYAGKLERVLPATKVARYIQIENKIRALVRAELAGKIPLIY
jgi:hypothetical protein